MSVIDYFCIEFLFYSDGTAHLDLAYFKMVRDAMVGKRWMEGNFERNERNIDIVKKTYKKISWYCEN